MPGFPDAFALLVIAAQQEEDLRLEGIASAVTVEIAEKRIFLKNLQQEFRFKIGL